MLTWKAITSKTWSSSEFMHQILASGMDVPGWGEGEVTSCLLKMLPHYPKTNGQTIVFRASVLPVHSGMLQQSFAHVTNRGTSTISSSTFVTLATSCWTSINLYYGRHSGQTSLLRRQLLLVGSFLGGGGGENAPPPPIQEEGSCPPNLNELFAFCACCSEHTKM